MNQFLQIFNILKVEIAFNEVKPISANEFVCNFTLVIIDWNTESIFEWHLVHKFFFSLSKYMLKLSNNKLVQTIIYETSFFFILLSEQACTFHLLPKCSTRTISSTHFFQFCCCFVWMTRFVPLKLDDIKLNAVICSNSLLLKIT